MELEEQIRNQLVDQLTNETNSKVELDDWINQSSKNRRSYSAFNKIWKATGIVSIMNKFDAERAWTSVDSKIQKDHVLRIRMQKVMYAVSGIAATLILVLGLAFYSGQFSSELNHMKLATKYGSRTELTLPDGTLVTLNSGSDIEYNYNKVSHTREVEFEGEAFFKVAKSKKPFVIHTPEGMNLKVLGTSFNLSVYPEDKFIETTLIEGRVELSNPKGEKLILLPGQLASYNRLSNEIVAHETNPSHKIGWLNSKIYLDNTSLYNLSSKLERRFDIQIELSPQEIGNEIHYTGVLEEGNVLEILKALSELSDIKYEVSGKKITIKGE